MKQSAIQELLVWSLLRKYNLPKLNYVNLEKLAQIIKQAGFASMSANTLARISGLRKDQRKTYEYNLDLLSSLLGFGTFRNFEKFIRRTPVINKHNPLPDKMDEGFLVSYIAEAAQNNDLKFLSSIEKYIADNGIDPNAFFSIGYSLMLGCRENKNPRKLIQFSTSSSILTRLFYETYVDLEYLNGYFGEAMTTLSYIKSIDNTTGLYASSIAYLFEKNSKRVAAYRKRGRALNEVSEQILSKMVVEREIYPVARWLRATIDYSSVTGNSARLKELFELALSLIEGFDADDAIIIISELSELDLVCFSPAYWLKLKEAYLLFCNQIFYEIDSSLNAALNLSLKIGCRDLITYSQALETFETHPLTFVTRTQHILKRINQLH